MPYHRSITRINRNQNKDAAINICCAIILAYVILSLVLSSLNVDNGVIFFIVFGTFSTGTCVICCCLTNPHTSYDNESENGDTIPTITAYPISENHESFQDLVPVICTPVVE